MLCFHMKTYSVDMRQRIIERKEQGESSESIAKLFRISKRSVDRFWKRKNETGSIEPSKIGGYRVSLLDPHIALLRRWIRTMPDITLDELVERCASDLGIRIGRIAVWNILDRADLTFKKNDTRVRARQARRDGTTRSVEAKPAVPRRKKARVS